MKIRNCPATVCARDTRRVKSDDLCARRTRRFVGVLRQGIGTPVRARPMPNSLRDGHLCCHSPDTPPKVWRPRPRPPCPGPHRGPQAGDPTLTVYIDPVGGILLVASCAVGYCVSKHTGQGLVGKGDIVGAHCLRHRGADSARAHPRRGLLGGEVTRTDGHRKHREASIASNDHPQRFGGRHPCAAEIGLTVTHRAPSRPARQQRWRAGPTPLPRAGPGSLPVRGRLRAAYGVGADRLIGCNDDAGADGEVPGPPERRRTRTAPGRRAAGRVGGGAGPGNPVQRDPGEDDAGQLWGARRRWSAWWGRRDRTRRLDQSVSKS